jgi:hypothetical protein
MHRAARRASAALCPLNEGMAAGWAALYLRDVDTVVAMKPLLTDAALLTWRGCPTATCTLFPSPLLWLFGSEPGRPEAGCGGFVHRLFPDCPSMSAVTPLALFSPLLQTPGLAVLLPAPTDEPCIAPNLSLREGGRIASSLGWERVGVLAAEVNGTPCPCRCCSCCSCSCCCCL